ncbi:MAG: ATP-binding cassette domain-containing protein [Novosphingopyxis baekryungensis]|jgi:osmoprotectant transport system ATP-binding protein|nr:ATP-binding cassette domain-containing protein [Novosphingopyxis baekryungensis]
MGETETTGPVVRFEHVTKRYGDVAAVDGVSLEIAAGSFVALVGQSGSGKSTLLKTINRLIVPDEGHVLLDGGDVAAQEPHALRRSIGYVFQNIGLFPHMTVAENILIDRRIAGEAGGGDAGALLDMVELPRAFASRRPTELSGGQAQRVGVARALAGRPGLMLMDEPFGALDPLTRDTLGETYRRLHERLGMTTLMVTHDMAEALLHADRVLVMSHGQVIADDTPDGIMNEPLPEAAQALVAVPRRQAERLVAMERAGRKAQP